jgi:hypothetical protein
MSNRKSQTLRMIPVFLVSAIIIIGAASKISGYHPMLNHFIEMSLNDYLRLLGILETSFVALFLLPATGKPGLVLLAGYFGGAMAAQMPYHKVIAPAVPLMLIWIAAFVREPPLFLNHRSINPPVSSF